MHVMIDLETLGNEPDAAIIQIGAVTFTLEEGIKHTFKANIDFNDAIKHGSVTGDTIRWWLSQSEETRKSVIDEFSYKYFLSEALTKLDQFIHTKALGRVDNSEPVYFWSHATFDFPILSSAYKKIKHDNPIPYRNQRDLRTLEHFYGNHIEWQERQGVHHDALDDCIQQAKHAIKMLRLVPIS